MKNENRWKYGCWLFFIAIFTTFFLNGALIGVWKYENISMEYPSLRDSDEGEEHMY